MLDNLAKFVHDANAVPSFAFASSGTDTVIDAASGSAAGTFNDVVLGSGGVLNSLGISGAASRTNQAAWTMTPVTNPRQLELMRCAYQRVVANCGCGAEPIGCPDCRKRFNQFYTGSPFATDISDAGTPTYRFDDDGRVSNLVSGPVDPNCVRFGECRTCPTPEPCRCRNGDEPVDPNCLRQPCMTQTGLEGAVDCYASPPGSGIVNSECLGTDCPCWFCWGCKKCVPKNCEYVGHYRNTYVWVPRGPGRNELAKLTLMILDFAVNQAAQPPQKEVFAFLKSNGCPTTPQEAQMIVRSTIPVRTPSLSLLAADIRTGGAAQNISLNCNMSQLVLAQLIEAQQEEFRMAQEAAKRCRDSQKIPESAIQLLGTLSFAQPGSSGIKQRADSSNPETIYSTKDKTRADNALKRFVRINKMSTDDAAEAIISHLSSLKGLPTANEIDKDSIKKQAADTQDYLTLLLLENAGKETTETLREIARERGFKSEMDSLMHATRRQARRLPPVPPRQGGSVPQPNAGLLFLQQQLGTTVPVGGPF